MSDFLEQIGLSKKELQERVIDRITKSVLHNTIIDEDDEDAPARYAGDSRFAQMMNAHVKAQIDAKVAELAEKHVLPSIADLIENFTLQTTNTWGEKVGKQTTFIEYLTQRADEYIREKVNYDGKTKEESGNYNFSGTQTRIAHLIDRHLHYSIETAMKNALSTANKAIVAGIEETIKIKLGEIQKSISVAVKL